MLGIFHKHSLILIPLLGRFYSYFWGLVNSDSVGLGRVQDSAFLTGSWVLVMDYIFSSILLIGKESDSSRISNFSEITQLEVESPTDTLIS